MTSLHSVKSPISHRKVRAVLVSEQPVNNSWHQLQGKLKEWFGILGSTLGFELTKLTASCWLLRHIQWTYESGIHFLIYLKARCWVSIFPRRLNQSFKFGFIAHYYPIINSELGLCLYDQFIFVHVQIWQTTWDVIILWVLVSCLVISNKLR